MLLSCQNPHGTINASLRPTQLLRTYDKSSLNKTQVFDLSFNADIDNVKFSFQVKKVNSANTFQITDVHVVLKISLNNSFMACTVTICKLACIICIT